MAEQEKNPPPVTEEELRGLPRWATVAFAARCARRVQPLFEAGWPDAPEEHKEAVERAIVVTESSAGQFPRTPSPRSWIYEIANTVRHALDAAHAVDPARSAACAARTALAANPSALGLNEKVAAAAEKAADAAVESNGYTRGNINIAPRAADVDAAAQRRDFELLRACAAKEGWTDETPVPPEFFGPLWPEGEPEGWPTTEEKAKDHELVLELDLPADLSEEEAQERLWQIIDAADDLADAAGAGGLKIKGVQIHGGARTPAPTPDPTPEGSPA